jgi:rhodanese-related sulfurtransferase
MKHTITGFILGALTVYLAITSVSSSVPTEEDKIAAYYANTAATLVSPHNVRERMSSSKNNYVLIDTRAVEDYERGHIVTAINIDTGTGGEKTTDDVLREFRTVIEENPNKEIIIYCYSASCMNGRKVGNFLANNGVFVKELTIGWNEWRYNWRTWNYDTEWDTYDVDDFWVAGTEPGGVPDSGKSITPCSIEGELSC